MARDKEKGEKTYQPPTVKEIGGNFEQALGISNCTVGGAFVLDCAAGTAFSEPCGFGGVPSGSGCSVGLSDQACATGGGDVGTCSMGTAG